MTKRLFVTGLIVVLVGAVAVPSVAARQAKASPSPAAHSDTAKERALQLLRQGNAKLDQGIYLEALALFQKAYRIFPSPMLLFNIAQTYNELGRFLEALSTYERFVRELKPSPSTKKLLATAHARTYALRGKVAALEVVTNVFQATLIINGTKYGETPLKGPLRLMPGKYSVELTKPGYARAVTHIVLKGGEGKSVRLKLLTKAQAARKLALVKALERRRRALRLKLRMEQLEAARHTRKRQRIYRISGWTALALGTASALVGGILGILGEQASRKVEGSGLQTPWLDVDQEQAKAEQYWNVMYYALPIGAAVAVAGAVLVGLSYREKIREVESRPSADERPTWRLTPQVGPGGAAVRFSLAF